MRHLVARIRSFIAAFFGRQQIDRGIDEEFVHHIELRAADIQRAGATPEAALHQARLEFGNVTSWKESTRVSRDTAWMDSIGQDVQYTLRMLRRNPGFTLVAVLSLGIGIGATTAVLSVIDAFDVRPLPFANADRLVWPTEVTPRDDKGCAHCEWLSGSMLVQDWTHAQSFSAVGAHDLTIPTWEHGDAVESISMLSVTPGFLGLLGTRVMAGREFLSSDTIAAAEPVIMVSHEFWKTRLGGIPGVVGSTLLMPDPVDASRSRPTTVVGVLAPGFRFRNDAEVWAPLRLSSAKSRGDRGVNALARLRDGVNIATANTEIATMSARLASTDSLTSFGWTATVHSLREFMTNGVAKGRYMLLALVFVVLLIATLNVAGLLVARSVARQREFAMRSALGAGRARLIRQTIVEGTCIAIAGGVLGVIIAVWATKFIPQWFSVDHAGLAVQIDLRMLLMAALLSTIVGVCAAVLPAIRAGRTDAGQSLRSGSASRSLHVGRMSNALVAAQISLALVLFTTAMLLGRDYMEVRYFDLGYEPANLYHSGMSAPRRERLDPAVWRAVPEGVRAQIAALPGISGVAVEHRSPMFPAVVRAADGQPVHTGRSPQLSAVDTSYFSVFGTHLVSGRLFNQTDVRGAPLVAVINKSMADLLWPGVNAIGQRMFVGDTNSVGELLTVVGVIANIERFEMIQRHFPVAFRPLDQALLYHTGVSIHLRVAEAAQSERVLGAAAGIIRAATGRPAPSFTSAEASIGRRTHERKANTTMLTLLAAFGLLLAMMGTYGTVAYSVAQRTREVGIRMALGAKSSSVIAVVTRGAMRSVLAGVAIGTGSVFVVTRLLKTFLVATSGTSPIVVAGSTTFVIAIALLAALLPARRATRVDALVALRTE